MLKQLGKAATLGWIATTILVLVAGAVVTQLLDGPDRLTWALVFVIAILSLVVIWRWRARAEEDQRQEIDERRREAEENARRERLRGEFALCKPVPELRPEDFGFEVVAKNEEPERYDTRPYYERYVPRGIALFDPKVEPSQPVFTEETIAAELRRGKGFVLHGPPTMGKTRTLYEIVTGLREWMVIAPRKDAPAPKPDVFETLISGKNVIVVLEDMNDLVRNPIDWPALCGPDGLGKARQWAIAATCRSGPELSAVKDATDSPLRKLYDERLPLKLTFVRTDEEIVSVAESAGRTISVEEASRYHTPGEVVMEDALRHMRTRFEKLPSSRQDLLRAIQLLIAGGVLPLTHERIKAVLKGVFGRESADADFRSELDELSDDDFLAAPGRQDPVVQRPAYMEPPVVTTPGQSSPTEQLVDLRNVLATLSDVEGLFYLGNSLANQEEYANAIEAYDASLAVLPNDADTLLNKGAVLSRLGRHAEALAAYDVSLAAWPDRADTLYNKGVALSALRRHTEALAAFEASLAMRPDHAETLMNKGAMLGRLGRYAEALAAFDASLAAWPDRADTLYNKGIVQSALGRHAEALAAYEASLVVQSNDPNALHYKGISLGALGRHAEALAAYEASLVVRPDHAETLYNRGAALSALDRHAEALAVYEALLAERPNDADTLYNTGIVLFRLKRYGDALAVFEASLAVRPDHPDTLNFKGAALFSLERYDEAVATYEASLAVRPDDAETLYNKGAALFSLERYDEAVATFDASLAVRLGDPNALLLKGLALLELDIGDEARLTIQQAIEAGHPEAADVFLELFGDEERDEAAPDA